jgi:YYY domain-containing protein
VPLRRRHATTTNAPARRSPSGYTLALLAILLLAAGLRFIGLDWDNGYYLHPDERFMVMVTVDTSWPESVGQYFDSETSPLNPYNTRHGTFVYGTFPLFLTKAISGLFDNDVYGQAHLAGRAISALADTGTVFLTAWIARRFFGDKAGLLAGALIAFTMLHIQSAHFYTVDAVSVFFATATFVTVVKGWDKKSLGWFAIAGLMAGLAGASKPNYLIALGFFALPVLETIRLHGIDGLLPSSRRRAFPVIPALVVAGLVAFWTFRVGQPYAFNGPNIWNIGLNRQWVDDLSYWSSAQSGLIDIKSSVQWVGRTPIAYIVENMVRWGMGPPLGIASLAALGFGIWRLVRSRNWPSWWLTGMIAWSLIQLVLYGTNIAQAQRYLLPIYPFLIAWAAGLLVEMARSRGPGVGWLPGLGKVAIAITVLYTAFYGIAFDTLYVRPLSRVQASEWIYENVPPGSAITNEYWDDALPMPLPGEDAWAYTGVTLDLYGYEGQDSTKLSKIIGQLNQADYIVLSSNRIIDSVPRQPERYPMATHYYEMLIDGSLGFDLVAEFKETPELLGIAIDDSNAEETLTVYEHPYVRIFKKSDRFDLQAVYAELNEAMGYGGVNYLPGDPVGDQMFLTQDEWSAYNEAGTWSDVYDRESFTNRAPSVWWYLGMQLLALPAIPLAWLLFRRFPDGGYAVAKALGILLVTWLAWALSSMTALPFGRLSILLCWTLVAAAGFFLMRKRLHEMANDMRSRWRWILATEMIFLVAFAGMAWVRSHNAAFWVAGGSDATPWYLAMFNAAARSVSFPPFDAWLGGGQLHTPYWGIMPWVLLSRLTGVVPNVAYTLAFAGIFALLCATVWSVAAAIIERIARRRTFAGWMALLAPMLVGLAGTLNVAGKAGQGFWGYTPKPDGWPVGGIVGDVLYGVGNLLTQRPDLPATFLSEATTIGVASTFTAPFASILTGDLGPGAASLPIVALALAIATVIALPECCSSGEAPPISVGVLPILAGGLVTGLLAASATWGLLVGAAVMLVAIVIRAFGLHGVEESWRLTRRIVLDAASLGAVAILASWPFSREFVQTLRNRASGSILTLDELVLIAGGLLAILAVYLLTGAARILRETRHEGFAGRAATFGTLLLAATGILGALLLGNALLFLIVTLLVIALALWGEQHEPAHLLVAGFVGLGVLVLLYAPLASLPHDPFGNSTAVELTGVIWMLFGIAATAAVAWLAVHALTPGNMPRSLAASVALIGSVLIAFSLLTAPALFTRSVMAEATMRSLDATASLSNPGDPAANEADLAAANWLMENVDGLPIVLESAGWDRQYGGRISAMTGLPTVVGWTGPERITRPGWDQVVTWRQEAVNRIYGSTGDFAGIEPLLVQYDVDLIYIGPLERQSYSAMSLRKFEDAAETGELRIIYDRDGVTIYAYQGGVG